MTGAAGTVNDRGRDEDAAFVELLAGSSPLGRAVARAVRDLVYDILPATVEVVWLRQRSVGWGTGERKSTEQFAYLMPYARHVTLGFYHGGELPDPSGLLPDTGGTQGRGRLSMRSLRLTTLEEVARPELRRLIEVATRTGVPPARA
jgi:hypothetical protein